MGELIPCPFCGGEAENRDYNPAHPYKPFGMVVDHTQDCWFSIPADADDGDFTAAWQRRHVPEGWQCVRPGEESDGPYLCTPLHISLLIHCCVMAGPVPEPRRSAPATTEYLAQLQQWGAITPDGTGWYECTERGREWLKNLQMVPMPGDRNDQVRG